MTKSNDVRDSLSDLEILPNGFNSMNKVCISYKIKDIGYRYRLYLLQKQTF